MEASTGSTLENAGPQSSEIIRLKRENATLQKQLQEFTAKVAEEATLREAVHQSLANPLQLQPQQHLASVSAAVAAAKESLGVAEMAWAAKSLKTLRKSNDERVAQSYRRSQYYSKVFRKWQGIVAERKSSATKKVDPPGATDKIKANFKAMVERSASHPSKGSLVSMQYLKQIVCSLKEGDLTEKDIDFLMDSFRLQQGIESDTMACFNAFVDFLFQTECVEPASQIQEANGISNGNGQAPEESTTNSKASPASEDFDEGNAEHVMDHLRTVLNANDHYDLVVLGAGPAGLKAASECAQEGFRVVLIDPKESITGAPTGAFSKCVREAAMAGATTWAEVEKLLRHVQQDTERMAANRIVNRHVNLLKGSATFLDHETLLFQSVQGEARQLKADCIVIATGSRALRVPNIPFDSPGVFDSDSIHNISYIPKNMVVQGAGIIAVEYAMIFALLGSKVILLGRSDRILPTVDKDLRQALVQRLEKQNVDLRLKTPVKGVESADGCSAESPSLLVDTGGAILECDCFLSATGRIGSSDGLGLENLTHAGIKLKRNKTIEVNEFQHTGVGNIYAIGDVADGSLETVGQAQAMQAIHHQFGWKGEAPFCRAKPCVVWTVPEIAFTGLCEETAAMQGIDFGIVRAEYGNTFRGMISGEKGFMKLIFNRKDATVIGVHCVGEHSSDLINYGAELVNEGATIFDIREFIFPAVTYHQIYQFVASRAKHKLTGVISLSASIIWRQINVALHKKGLGNRALQALFDNFDEDHSGHISINEVYSTLSERLALGISKDQVNEMIVEADDNGNNLIEWKEFHKALGTKVHHFENDVELHAHQSNSSRFFE